MDKKVVLVTGSSIGLGRAIIEKFASNNYNVIINYNNSKQEAEELKSYIENTYHTKAITIKCDITKESEIEEMKQIIIKEFGVLDCLVNNAGIAIDTDFNLKTKEDFIKTLDTNMVGALVVAGIVVYLHNKYFDTKLPEWLGVFKGSCFVCAIGFFVMLALAVVFCCVWPIIQTGMKSLQGFFMASGALGVWVFTFCERILIPTGLHHFVYMPFAYESIAVDGGIKAAWALNLSEYAASSKSLATLFPAGRFALYGHSKIFAAPGISLAFYATAKKNKKKEVMGLMLPVALTAVLCGITEPIEFTFLFAAPFLWPIHAVLAATLATIEYFVVGISGEFSSGLINWLALDWIPMAKNHMGQILAQIAVGLIFTALWFFIFSFCIKKFDLKTPGREDDEEEAKLMSKKDYKAAKAAEEDTSNDPTGSIEVEGGDAAKAKKFLELVGGKDNVEDVTNCATRLRLTLKDDSLLADMSAFKKAGAHGLVHKGKAVQIIVGLSVPSVREEFENLLD